jgi:deoxyribonuclease V
LSCPNRTPRTGHREWASGTVNGPVDGVEPLWRCAHNPSRGGTRRPWRLRAHDRSVQDERALWPPTDAKLIELQHRLASAADAVLATDPWTLPEHPFGVGGCFVAFVPGEAGPGRAGDRAWAAAVVWRACASNTRLRDVDAHLRGARSDSAPRRADDVIAQAVVERRVPDAYTPGLLARREGPILAAAVEALDERPDVLLVDASGLDHPRRAGLALHLGAVVDLPTVGVTRRPLVASGSEPESRREACAPLRLDGRCVAYWLCTRTGARPSVAHAGWRTTPETAVSTVLIASTESARTPVPLQEARRAAREARARADEMHNVSRNCRD